MVLIIIILVYQINYLKTNTSLRNDYQSVNNTDEKSQKTNTNRVILPDQSLFFIIHFYFRLYGVFLKKQLTGFSLSPFNCLMVL